MIFNQPLRVLLLTLSLGCAASSAASQDLPADSIAAVALAADGDFDQAAALSVDQVTTDLITWLRLRSGQGDFAEYGRFLAARPDWPDQNRLRARAEVKIAKGHDPAAVIAWFAGTAPQTGEGAVRLAEALLQSGRLEQAKTVLETAWLDLRLSEDGHDAMVAAFPDILLPLHVARADALLWRWRTVEAKRMIPLLDDDHVAWVNARIAFIRKTGGQDDAMADLPESLLNDPGLTYDRYNWLADNGRRTDAVEILRERSVSAAALGEPFRWSGWRRSLARWEMREGRTDSAYELASRHFLTDGSSFADLEWLAGYLALTYQNDPSLALAHFDAARGAVDSPISVGRMEYWRGRALDAQNNPDAAAAAYVAAAMHQTSFYGLLASEKIGKPLSTDLTGAGDPQDWQAANIIDHDLIRAGVMLLAADERGAAVPFFVALGQTLPADDLSRLGALLAHMDQPYFQVLIGKTAVTRGVLVPSIYFPLHDLATMDLPAPASLSLSIARRESEFNAGVGSPVGALGLMQLMPATAQEVAGLLDLPYSKSRLTADWTYNAQLGSKYLDMLRDQFGPSPVQIAAGYNAGPSRPEIWMDDRGDPRLGDVDVIDWIEHIPFRETRNYVMRVTESIPIYEARLTGTTGPVEFTALLVGSKPLVRPNARPQPVAQSLRPVARPEG